MSSSTSRPPGAAGGSGQPERSFFEIQRAALLEEIGISFEHVLQNINKLNRGLEGVIAVGNEFSSVEALWSQFENVMAKDPAAEGEGDEHRNEGQDESHIYASSEAATER